MSTFAPAGQGSTPSTSTAPSTGSPTPSSTDEGAPPDHDPNVTWGDDDPDKPQGWVAP